MVLEVALIDVRTGAEEAFGAAYRQGYPILAGTPGCRSVLMTRGIDSDLTAAWLRWRGR